MPSMSLILVRMVMMAPGTKHGTQQCSPIRFDILEAQQIGQQNTRQPVCTPPPAPHNSACQCYAVFKKKYADRINAKNAAEIWYRIA